MRTSVQILHSGATSTLMCRYWPQDRNAERCAKVGMGGVEWTAVEENDKGCLGRARPKDGIGPKDAVAGYGQAMPGSGYGKRGPSAPRARTHDIQAGCLRERNRGEFSSLYISSLRVSKV